MKLSKLITYKHMVDGLTVKHAYDQIEDLLKEVETNLDVEHLDFDNIKHDIAHSRSRIFKHLNNVDNKLQAFKDHLSGFFDSIEEPYYQKSQEIYQESLGDTSEYILDRYSFKKLIYEEETKDFFVNRIRQHTDWAWPAAEIRPAHGEFTDYLVSCDPLYLVDTREDLFLNIKKLWTPDYQRRLRYYVINEKIATPLGILPQNQMGFILAVDFFNFRPLDLIEKYLKSMFLTLRPGGVAIFTYNNCDYPIGVDNFEESYYCYTPGRQVKDLCAKHGFRVTASFDMDNNVSWLEIQKPGTRKTLRGGQSLAMIKELTKNPNITPEQQQQINQQNSVGNDQSSK